MRNSLLRLILTVFVVFLQAGACDVPRGPSLPASMIGQCLESNPELSTAECDLSRCITPHYFLNAMDTMLRDTVDIIEANKVPYWLEGGTLLGAMKFSSHLPFDDDVDIDMLENDFVPFKDVLEAELNKRGYELDMPWTGQWHIAFSENKKKEYLKETSGVSDEAVLERMYEDWPLDSWPLMDIFVMWEDKDSIGYTSPAWQDWASTSAFPKNLILPLEKDKHSILGRSYSTANNSVELANLIYGSKDIIHEFYAKSNHFTQCGTPIWFKNICDQPEWLKYMEIEIQKAYGNKFEGFPEPLKNCLPVDSEKGCWE